MPLEILESADVERLSRLLADYESGRLTPALLPAAPQKGIAVTTYTGLTTTAYDASDGEPVSGIVALFAYDWDAGAMSDTPYDYIEAFSLWDDAIAECEWVHLGLDPASGAYFIYSHTGTTGCGTGGSGTGGDDTGCGECPDGLPTEICATYESTGNPSVSGVATADNDPVCIDGFASWTSNGFVQGDTELPYNLEIDLCNGYLTATIFANNDNYNILDQWGTGDTLYPYAMPITLDNGDSTLTLTSGPCPSGDGSGSGPFDG